MFLRNLLASAASIASTSQDKKSEKPLSLLNTLLLHVVNGEQLEAEAIIVKHPELLVQSGQVESYAGFMIEGAPLQIALGAADVALQTDEECMVEMISTHLTKMKNGKAIMAKQIQAQFPIGWEAKAESQVKKDLAALNEVFDAIDDSTAEEKCVPAINKFRQYMDGKKCQLIKTGTHYHPELVEEVCRLYNQLFAAYGDPVLGLGSSYKIKLGWNLIGYVQRFLPACYAQALCQGLYHIIDKNAKLERRLTFSDGTVYYPLDKGTLKLGFHFARMWCMQNRQVCVRYIKELNHRKSQALQERISPLISIVIETPTPRPSR